MKRNVKLMAMLLVVALSFALCASAMASEAADPCAKGHSYKSIKKDESSCTKQGTETFKCQVSTCGHELTKNLPIKEHDWERTKKVEATCTKEGYKDYECKVCHATKTKTIEKAPHRYGSWEITKQPTCTEKGRRVHYCLRCGYESSGSIEKLPHPFGSWTVVREATDRSMGTEAHVCTTCGLRETRDFYPAGTLHADMEGSEAVRVLQQYLTDNGYLDSRIDGDYGKKTRLAVEAYQRAMGFEVTGIAYPQTLYAIFCTEAGKDGSAVMTNNAHVYGDWTILSEATSSAPGLRSHTCLYCGYVCEGAYNPVGTLTPGMDKCEEVKELQKLLIEKKIIKTIADGDYGKKTEQGVRDFQRMAGLEVTGIAYPETIEKLRNWN